VTTFLIARNTFREATRDRLLTGVFVAGLVLLLVTQVVSPLALGEGHRLTVDLSLSGASLLGLLTVLLVGTSLVAKEIERRTIYNLLSRPMTRHAYLVGKWAGLSAALFVVVTGIGIALCGLLALRGEARQAPFVLQAIYFAVLELTVITSLAVLFSALSTPVLSALYTLGCFLAGQWSNDLRQFATHAPHGPREMLQVAANVVPNLPLFNTRTLAANGEFASVAQVVIASAYALLYIGCVLALASAAFESRDFK
jgi:Cu-processing system permease protein